jgi:hypothetical protein
MPAFGPSATNFARNLEAQQIGYAGRRRTIALTLDPRGAKLSKSRQSASLAELRESGASPGEVRAALGFGAGDCSGLVVEFG